MPYLLRPSRFADFDSIFDLANSLSANGFLTLPHDEKGLENLIHTSEKSFNGKLASIDEGRYLFVMEDMKLRRVIGTSLLIARHGTATSPHLYFPIDPEKNTINFQADDEGKTELGGLVLQPDYRKKRAKLGKFLSYVRFLYLKRHRDRFLSKVIAELLPPFSPEGKSYLWESLGRRLTGMDYREADAKAKRDKRFVLSLFPRGPIEIKSLSEDAQLSIGMVGSETEPVVKLLANIGFRYLQQIDPFDGGPHYGAATDEIRYDIVEDFFENQADESEVRWMLTSL